MAPRLKAQFYPIEEKIMKTLKQLLAEKNRPLAVVAPSDGWVVYAGEFRSYGQV